LRLSKGHKAKGWEAERRGSGEAEEQVEAEAEVEKSITKKGER